jgi:hypothetical protein
MRYSLVFISIFSFLFLLSACTNSAKYYLKAHSDSKNSHKRVFDEFLLVKNSISPVKKNKSILCEDSILIHPQSYKIDKALSSEIYYDLYAMLRQKPNQSFLFTKLRLWVYNLTDTIRVKYVFDENFEYLNNEGVLVKGGIRPDTLSIKKRVGDSVVYKSGILRKFLMSKIGEPPTIFDKKKAELTARSMKNYLIQKGFVNAEAGYQVKMNKHSASVSYYYSTGKPIVIDSVFFDSKDEAIKTILTELEGKSELKTGMLMDKNAFLKERTRLTAEIRNRGYFNFNWNYISYIADTANASKIPEKEINTILGPRKSSKIGEQGESRVQIFVNIMPPSDSVLNHPKFTIDKVFVVLDEPKVEIHKIKRKYLMDSSFVVMHPSKANERKSFIHQSHIDENRNTVYFCFHANDCENFINNLSKNNSRSVFLAGGSKYPHWISLKEAPTVDSKYKIGTVKIDSPHIEFEFPRNGHSSFYHSPVSYDFYFKNPSDDKFYLAKIRPYRKKFRIDSYNKIEKIDREDIPLHIVLRKPAKTVATDSLEAARELNKIRKINFIVKDRTISQFVQIGSGGLYNYDAGRETVNRISELEIFRFPRVEYVPAKSNFHNSLDAYVFMQRGKKQSFGFETDINSSNANLGWALNANYKNRNIFKGAELLMFNVEGGINFNFKRDTSTRVSGIVQWINLLDVNSSLSLYIPKIVGFRNWTLGVEGAKTKVSIGYHYLQQSTDFRVSSFDAVYSYEWTLKKKQHIFSWAPFMVNFTLKPILDPIFEATLKLNNFALWASLNDRYFLPGTNFSYQYLPKKSDKASFQLRIFAETVGNTAWLLNLITGKPLEVFGTQYSQYFKADVDIRYTYKFSKSHSIATRLMAGGAVPVGNSTRVPYSRQFFLGGPASMRGWNMRQLGPGKMRVNESAYFQLGDLRLEMNAEYRFMFNNWIGAAIFVDAGNIWMSNAPTQTTSIPYATVENGQFNARFLEELAVDCGFGIRLDMSFFVLRLDLAVPIRDPAGFPRVDSNGFVQYLGVNGYPNYWKFDYTNTNFLLAVGYPF